MIALTIIWWGRVPVVLGIGYWVILVILVHFWCRSHTRICSSDQMSQSELMGPFDSLLWYTFFNFSTWDRSFAFFILFGNGLSKVKLLVFALHSNLATEVPSALYHLQSWVHERKCLLLLSLFKVWNLNPEFSKYQT